MGHLRGCRAANGFANKTLRDERDRWDVGDSHCAGSYVSETRRYARNGETLVVVLITQATGGGLLTRAPWLLPRRGEHRGTVAAGESSGRAGA
jgi:hypothetical protein